MILIWRAQYHDWGMGGYFFERLFSFNLIVYKCKIKLPWQINDALPPYCCNPYALSDPLAATNDVNDPSLESCSLMAARVVVNMLNGHDMSLNDSGGIGRHVTQRVYITHSCENFHLCPFSHSTHIPYSTGYRRNCNYGGWFCWPTHTFIQKINNFSCPRYMYFHHYEWLCLVWMPNTH